MINMKGVHKINRLLTSGRVQSLPKALKSGPDLSVVMQTWWSSLSPQEVRPSARPVCMVLWEINHLEA